MNRTQDDRATPAPAEAVSKVLLDDYEGTSPLGWKPNLLAINTWHATAKARHECALACMVGESLAPEMAELVAR